MGSGTEVCCESSALSVHSAVSAAYALLNERTRRKGGDDVFNRGVKHIQECLESHHDAGARKKAGLIVQAMSKNFRPDKTHIWRSYIILLLELLGAREADIKLAAKKSYVTQTHLRDARSVVDKVDLDDEQVNSTEASGSDKKRVEASERLEPSNKRKRVEPDRGGTPDRNSAHCRHGSVEPSNKRKIVEPDRSGTPEHNSAHCRHGSSIGHGSPNAAQSRALDPQGHYKALGISPGASASEIRSGYYRRALATHPDKPGGSLELFRPVQEAFELLSDSQQRAAYDGLSSGTKPNCHMDLHTNGSGPRAPGCNEANYVYAKLVVVPSSSWPSELAIVKEEVLASVLVELQNSHARNWSKAAPDTLVRCAELGTSHTGDVSANKVRGITRRNKAGYRVKVTWRQFNVESFGPIPTLELALQVHIALMQMRGEASDRHAKFKQDCLRIGCSEVEGTDDDCPPLLPEELFQAFLCEHPSVPLKFSSDLVRRGKTKGLKACEKRVESPMTPSLASALHFRSCTRRVLAQDYVAVAGADHIAIIKKIMEERAVEDRKVRQQLEARLITAVSDEIERRNQSTSEASSCKPANAAPFELEERRNQSISQPSSLAIEDGSPATVEAMQLARVVLESQKAENARLHEDAQRASRAEQSWRQEVVQLKHDMAKLQCVADARDSELRLAQQSKAEADQQVACHAASEHMRELEAERLKGEAALARAEVATKDVELKMALEQKADAEKCAERQSHEVAVLRDKLVSMQASVAMKEAELDTLAKCHNDFVSTFKASRPSQEFRQEKESYEKELLKQQQMINKLERQNSVAWAKAAESRPRINFRTGCDSPGSGEKERKMQECALAAARSARLRVTKHPKVRG